MTTELTAREVVEHMKKSALAIEGIPTAHVMAVTEYWIQQFELAIKNPEHMGYRVRVK